MHSGVMLCRVHTLLLVQIPDMSLPRAQDRPLKQLFHDSIAPLSYDYEAMSHVQLPNHRALGRRLINHSCSIIRTFRQTTVANCFLIHSVF